MSAGFRTSYGDISRRDITHIYSGTPPGDIRLRVTSYHQGIDPLDRQREKRCVTPGRLPWRYYDYIPEYNTYIQKASGFQDLPRRKIMKCVNRLTNKKSFRQIQLEKKEFHKQEAALNRPSSAQGRIGLNNQTIIPGSNNKGVSRDLKQSRHLKTQRDVNMMVERLYKGKRDHGTGNTNRKQDMLEMKE